MRTTSKGLRGIVMILGVEAAILAGFLVAGQVQAQHRESIPRELPFCHIIHARSVSGTVVGYSILNSTVTIQTNRGKKVTIEVSRTKTQIVMSAVGTLDSLVQAYQQHRVRVVAFFGIGFPIVTPFKPADHSPEHGHTGMQEHGKASKARGSHGTPASGGRCVGSPDQSTQSLVASRLVVRVTGLGMPIPVAEHSRPSALKR